MSPSRFLRSSVVAFAGREDGNVAITFSLALLPVILAVGSGIDYARATTERATLQQGTDAAALAGIQALRKGQTVTQAYPLIQQVVATNDVNPNATVSNVNLSSDGSTLCVTSKSSVATAIMGIMGVQTINVAAYACSAMRLDTYEIAFAFDNSGSMSNSAQSGGDTKLQAAVKAANGLISALAGTGGTGSLPASYSVVPFNALVNVGAQYASSSFMDVNAQSSIHWQNFLRPSSVKNLPASKFAMFTNMSTSWGGCVEERPGSYTTTDTAASSSTPDTLYVPFLWPDETDTNANNTSKNNYNAYTMNNYLDDEGGSCKKNDASYTADQNQGTGDGQTKLCKYTATPSTSTKNYTTGIAASPNASCTTIALQPLDSSASTTGTTLSNMKAGGDTALVTGFMWAWRTISPKGPFDPSTNPSPSSPNTQQKPKAYNFVDPTTSAVNHKVIILMTDGMDHWYGMHGDPNDQGYINASYDANKSTYNAFGWFANNRLGQTDANSARTLLDNALSSACTNAKNATDTSGNSAPVEIFTVGFLATDGIDSAGQTLLKNCATDSNHAFIATTGDDLVAAFQTIAATITQPRIAR